jgi:hypothetical protein
LCVVPGIKMVTNDVSNEFWWGKLLLKM